MKKSVLTKVVLMSTLLGTSTQLVPLDQIINHGQSQQSNMAYAAEKGVVEGFAWFEGSNAPWTDAEATLKNNTYQKGTDFMVMGLEVRLKNNLGAVIQTKYTDGQGKFAFDPVPDGDYLVSFINPLVWSPVISNITLGVDPSNDSDGPTDVLVRVVDGVAHAEAPTQELDAYVSQGFYTGTGALVNSGKGPVITDGTNPDGSAAPSITGGQNIEGIVNTKFPTIPFSVADDDKEPAQVTVTGLPPGMNYVPQDPQTVIDGAGNITFTQNSTIEGTPTQVGTYPITVTATDKFGNTSERKFTIVVKDVPNNKPVLTVNDTTVKYGDTFNPKSIATAVDEGKDVTSQIVVSGDKVDTTKPGVYNVTYTITDAGGLSDTKTVKVTVAPKPNSNPILDVTNQTIQYGDKTPLKDLAKATDPDGDTVTITTNPGTVDTSKPGTYNVTYTADDGKGGVVTKTVTITVAAKPNTAPTLTVADKTIPYGDKTPLKDLAKATDPDGDTVTITTSPGTLDTTKPGTYPIVFTADDGKGGVDTKIVNITVDKKPNANPVLTVDNQTIPYGDKTPLKDLAKTTDSDGDTVTVTTNPGTLDTSKPGNYTVTYTANDGNGGTDTKTVTITVAPKPNGAPTLDVADKTIIKGTTPNWLDGVKAIDPDQGDITDQVKIDTSKVDLTKGGTYPVTYTITDDAGVTVSKTINVTVQPTNFAPKIIVDDEYILEGSTFDPMDGVWAIDKDDVDLTDQVKLTSGSVDTSKPGQYDLTYSVTDSDGHVTNRTVTITVGKDAQKAIDSINAQIKDLQAKDAAQDARLDKLEKDMASLDGRVSNLEKEVAAIKAEIAAMQDQIKVLQDKQDALQGQIDKVKGDVTALQNQSGDAQKQIDALKDSVNGLNDRLTTAENKIEELTKRVDAHDAKISALENKVTTHELAIKELNDKINALDGRVSTNEKEIATLKTKVDALEKEVITIKGQIKDLQDKVNKLEISDAQFKEEMTKLNDRVTNLETKYEALKTQVDKNTADISSLTTKVDNHENRINQLETKVNSIEKEIKVLQDKTVKNEKDIKDLQTKVTNLEKEVKTIKDQITKLEKEITVIKDQIKVLQDADKKHDSEIKDLKDKVTTLENKVNTLEEKVKTIETKITELQNKPSVIINNINNNTNINGSKAATPKDETKVTDSKDNTKVDPKDDTKVTDPKDDTKVDPKDNTKVTDSKDNTSNTNPADNNKVSDANNNDVNKDGLPDTGQSSKAGLIALLSIIGLASGAGFLAFKKRKSEK